MSVSPARRTRTSKSHESSPKLMRMGVALPARVAELIIEDMARTKAPVDTAVEEMLDEMNGDVEERFLADAWHPHATVHNVVERLAWSTGWPTSSSDPGD